MLKISSLRGSNQFCLNYCTCYSACFQLNSTHRMYILSLKCTVYFCFCPPDNLFRPITTNIGQRTNTRLYLVKPSICSKITRTADPLICHYLKKMSMLSLSSDCCQHFSRILRNLVGIIIWANLSCFFGRLRAISVFDNHSVQLK